MPRLTVFTPTYNRAHTLSRAFDSLMKQSVKDFEWLIIDDGSTDSTEELINTFKETADFDIRYFWKPNGGRHTAVNYSYDKLRTEYVVTCDSDDALTPNAVESILNTWDSIPENERERYWCVTGREMNAETGEMVGLPFPENINALSGKKKRKAILRCPGEKHCCRRTDVLIQHPFPVYEDTRFVTENTVWEAINKKYDQYCVNDFYGYYYTNSADSLSKSNLRKFSRYRTFYYAGVFYVNEMLHELTFNKDVRFFTVNLSRCAMLTDTPYKVVMRALKSPFRRFLVTLGYPISWLWIKTHINKNNYNKEG